MCTVSIVPLHNGHVFTFNRDEKPERHTSEFIKSKHLEHKKIYYTEDSKSGGTWFATDNLGNAAMLFNGAFIKHQKLPTYIKSRGIILLELITQQNMLKYFEENMLTFVEPFSILLVEKSNLYRLTWDGDEKHFTPLSKHNSYIFSSVTLYDDTIQYQRQQWINDFLEHNPPTADNLIRFHSCYKSEDKQNGLIIDRPSGCSTLSISQLFITENGASLKHIDLISGNHYDYQILFNVMHENEIPAP